MTLDKSAARIRQMFGQIARRYDLLNHLLSLGIDRRWRRPHGRAGLAGRGGEVDPRRLHGHGRSGAGLRPGRRPGGADRRQRFLPADAGGGRGEVPPRRGRRADRPGGGRQLAVALCRRRVRHRLRGLRAAQPERHRRRAAGDGPRLPARRAGGGAGVLDTPRRPLAAVYDWYFRRVLPRVGQTLAQNRQGAYNYLPASVGQFPQGEALAERMRAAGLDGVVLPGVHPGSMHPLHGQKSRPIGPRGDAS